MSEESWKSIKGFRRYGADTKFKGKSFVTLTCDLESGQLGHVLCPPSYWEEHMSEVSWKSIKGFRRYGAAHKSVTDGLMDGRLTDRWRAFLYRLGPRVKNFKNGYPESSKKCYNIYLKKYIWCIRNHCIASFSELHNATRANKVW